MFNPLSDINVRTAKYAAPVQGSSTNATKTPRKKAVKGLSDTFVTYTLMRFASDGKIEREIPLPYQKKSLISSRPARMMSAAITRYIVTDVFAKERMIGSNKPPAIK